MSQELGITKENWDHIIQNIATRGNDEHGWNRKMQYIKRELTPLYALFFRQVIMEREGLLFLLSLRTDLLSILKTSQSSHLKAMDECLKEQLIDWYSSGFLALQEIKWSSAASIIETIMKHEAVHPVKEFIHIKYRLNGITRRCFAFCHTAIPDIPAAFIMIAFMDHIPSNIRDITKMESEIHTDIDESCIKETKASCAIFYSISATQRGLSGIDLGAGLIKQTLSKISKEYSSQIKHYCTLSPIPGFRQWLYKTLLQENNQNSDLLMISKDYTRFHQLLLEYQSKDINSYNLIKDTITKYCIKYLYREKWRGRALNPVANFHLKNGAVLWRINWMADESDHGLDQSLGMMVNYYYDPLELDLNSSQYTLEGIIPIGNKVSPLIS